MIALKNCVGSTRRYHCIMDQERTTGHAAAGRWELYHEARRTMIGSVWGSGSQSFRTILASSWGLVSFRGSRQTKMNHDWISLWIMFSIIWDNFGVNVEPFLVPKIARGTIFGAKIRPRSPMSTPKAPQAPPNGARDVPRAPLWKPQWAQGRPQSAKWGPDGTPKGGKTGQRNDPKSSSKEKQ
jgi:hypothetical protein